MFDIQAYENEHGLGRWGQSCSYLSGPKANLFYVRCHSHRDYRNLLDAGYRRSGNMAYRTDCHPCHECKIIRLKTDAFRPTRSQKRILNRNKDFFTVKLSLPSESDDKVRTYDDYLRYQHQTVYTGEGYSDFFVDSFLPHSYSQDGTFECCLYRYDRLAGVGILDRVGDVLSSVYFYFHPDFADRSPGVFSVLAEIELAKMLRLTYYYPGFYIKDCPAMNYKSNYGPHEIFTPPLAR
jgi:leucyl-tRNA---protein transferase